MAPPDDPLVEVGGPGEIKHVEEADLLRNRMSREAHLDGGISHHSTSQASRQSLGPCL
jgi:hypothetical protein